MADKTKFYVVWQGHQPGIYSNWADCQKQTQGFPKAKFKSFESKSEAERAFKDPDSVVSSYKKKQYYYVIWNGHQPGIYTDWTEAQKQISGFKGVIYKV